MIQDLYVYVQILFIVNVQNDQQFTEIKRILYHNSEKWII